jgi:hypothetical protein
MMMTYALPTAMTPELEDALGHTYEWYGHVLPAALTSPTYPAFIARSRQLMDYVHPGLPLRIDPKAQTAYTDGKSVTIPVIFLVPEFYDMFGIPAEHHAAAAVLLINGCQGHEAFHCELTPFGMIEYCALDTTGEASTLLAQYKGFKDCINVVEDVFIEAHGRRRWPALVGFVDGKNEIILGERALAAAIATIEAEDGSGYTIEAFLGLTAFNKNPRVRHDPLLIERVGPFLEITDQAYDPDLSPVERLEIAKQLFWALYDANEESGEAGGEFLESPLGEGMPNLDELDKDQIEALAKAMAEALKAAGVTEEELGEFAAYLRARRGAAQVHERRAPRLPGLPGRYPLPGGQGHHGRRRPLPDRGQGLPRLGAPRDVPPVHAGGEVRARRGDRPGRQDPVAAPTPHHHRRQGARQEQPAEGRAR